MVLPLSTGMELGRTGIAELTRTFFTEPHSPACITVFAEIAYLHSSKSLQQSGLRIELTELAAISAQKNGVFKKGNLT